MFAKVIPLINGAMRSKTIIVNVAVIIGGTLVYLSGNDVLAQYPDAAAWVASALAAVNVVLRMMTGETLTAKAEAAKASK